MITHVPEYCGIETVIRTIDEECVDGDAQLGQILRV
jgi:hypothetical protein